MIRFLSFSSGSSGNCYYLGNETSAVLIDAGVGTRTIKQRFAEYGVETSLIRGILVTHDHSDHVKGLGSLAKRLSLPVFTTSRLHDALSRSRYAEDCYPGCRRVIRPGMAYEYGGIRFFAFEVSHDATQTLSYGLEIDGVRIVLMTDLGEIPACAENVCREADYIIIESNYDLDMLLNGPYPADLKARIMSARGHLSNDLSACFMASVLHRGLKGIFLCHISKENNTPELAYGTMRRMLDRYPDRVAEDILLQSLPRTDVYETYLK